MKPNALNASHAEEGESKVVLEVAELALDSRAAAGSEHELSDAFIAMPGGVGTLAEIAELWAWAQLGLHEKPCGVLNVNAYFDDLLSFAGRGASDGLLDPDALALLTVRTTPGELLAAFGTASEGSVRSG